MQRNGLLRSLLLRLKLTKKSLQFKDRVSILISRFHLPRRVREARRKMNPILLEPRKDSLSCFRVIARQLMAKLLADFDQPGNPAFAPVPAAVPSPLVTLGLAPPANMTGKAQTFVNCGSLVAQKGMREGTALCFASVGPSRRHSLSGAR